MIKCRTVPYLTLILRSNHNLISLAKTPKKVPKKEKLTIKVPQKIRQSCNNDELLSKFPKEFYRKTKTNTKMSRQLYLINKETAEKIANHLTKSSIQSVTFVETNPGPGL